MQLVGKKWEVNRANYQVLSKSGRGFVSAWGVGGVNMENFGEGWVVLLTGHAKAFDDLAALSTT